LVPEYIEMNQSVCALVGRIDGRHGEASRTPIRYVNRSRSRATLSGLYRSARVGLVTPLRDGMNLVAKEYVAAQDPNHPGVLVLSQFAGASPGSGDLRPGFRRHDPPRHDAPQAEQRIIRQGFGFGA
jgi:trehalose 6-phosphate synthase